MRHEGWYQIAYERDLAEGLNEAAIGDRVVMLVRTGPSVRAFDGICPHRGANLCRGGVMEDAAVRCPFHSLSIRLSPGATGFSAQEHACFAVGGLVFVRLGQGADHGLADRLAAIDAVAYIVPGFAMPIAAPADLVIENAFDALHFAAVHGIGNRPQLLIDDAATGFAMTGRFDLPPSPWQRVAPGADHAAVPYRAQAYSPTIVLSELGGANPYTMLTATVPTGPRTCVVRLSLILPPGTNGAAPSVDACRYLLDGAERGLHEDRAIWEAMTPIPHFAPVAGDHGVTGFRAFCAQMQ